MLVPTPSPRSFGVKHWYPVDLRRGSGTIGLSKRATPKRKTRPARLLKSGRAGRKRRPKRELAKRIQRTINSTYDETSTLFDNSVDCKNSSARRTRSKRRTRRSDASRLRRVDREPLRGAGVRDRRIGTPRRPPGSRGRTRGRDGRERDAGEGRKARGRGPVGILHSRQSEERAATKPRERDSRKSALL